MPAETCLNDTYAWNIPSTLFMLCVSFHFTEARKTHNVLLMLTKYKLQVNFISKYFPELLKKNK